MRHELSQDDANLRDAVRIIRSAGGVAVQKRKICEDNGSLRTENVTVLSQDEETIKHAVKVLAHAFRSDSQRAAGATPRGTIIKDLNSIKNKAEELGNHLESLLPRTLKALDEALRAPSFQIKSYGAAIVSGRTQHDTELQQISTETFIKLLKFYSTRAELAVRRFPGGKGGRGNKPSQLEHGSPKGQLVVRLMDLMFPQELPDQEGSRVLPSGTSTGSLHMAAVAVATYADETTTNGRGFETQVEKAADLYAQRMNIIRAFDRQKRKRDRLLELGLLHQELAAKFAIMELNHARMLRLVGHQLQTL